MAGSIETRIALRGDVKDVLSKMNTFHNRVNRGNQKIQNSFKTTNTLITKMGGLMGGLALASSFKKLINTAGSFENAMSRVRAITRASDDDFQLLRNAALEMGRTTIYSSSQAAQALQELGMAGLDANQSVSALPQVLQLASAGQLQLADAANIVTGVMKGMNLEISDTQRINDVLAAASTAAKTDITSLGEAFANVSSTASALGVSLEDTTTLISTMANANISGSEAGNALKSSLLRLAAPTVEVAESLNEVGISVNDMANYINNGDIMGFFEQLRVSMANMSTSEKGAILSGLFGKQQAGKMAAIIGATQEQVDQLSNSISNSKGFTEQMANDGIGSWQKATKLLESAVEGLLIKLGDGGLLGVVTKFINNLSSFVSWITNLTGSFDSLIPVAYGAATAITVLYASLTGGLSAIVTAVSVAVVGIVTYWNDIIKAIEGGINAIIDFANKSTILRTAFVVAAEYIKFFYESVKTYLGFIVEYFKTLGTVIFKVFEAAWKKVKSLFTDDDYSFVDNITNEFKSAFDNIRNEAKESAEHLQNQLTTAVQNVADAYNGKEIAHVKLGLATTSTNVSKPSTNDNKKINSGWQAGDDFDFEFEDLNEELEIVDTKFKKLQETAEQVGNSISNVFNQTGNKIVSSLELAEDGMDGFKSTLLKTTIELLSMYLASALSAAISGGAAAGASTGPAAIATTPAFIATLTGGVLSAFAAIPRFQYGGMVGNARYHGDNVVARLNEGEGVLTRQGVANAAALYNSTSDNGVQTIRVIAKGDDLEGVAEYRNQKIRRF
ncbi:phage tail tape measure protein [Carboxylicivirga sp. RSCT41]|uniref:phage tail tape measure protein n=1 Tax=Carboxylicivirga agarovorans TaxID=3417570 RepID=UPI003D353969